MLKIFQTRARLQYLCQKLSRHELGELFSDRKEVYESLRHKISENEGLLKGFVKIFLELHVLVPLDFQVLARFKVLNFSSIVQAENRQSNSIADLQSEFHNLTAIQDQVQEVRKHMEILLHKWETIKSILENLTPLFDGSTATGHAHAPENRPHPTQTLARAKAALVCIFSHFSSLSLAHINIGL
ncbi:hypothetical protein GYMLUDRAFT_251088 [Collybiopsis luxurians FD-317 M1]|uniref:Uncharacterized protein n=1 Tax=Collybiopsis luxurians FD-317 M1 TaxID=944289 RepID=A0A0D0AQJ1_9AGAR|nr:hypothetical protein GYMLUDRAFT_251088 [Collybiopsis luxurians FD-317 M1]